MTKSPPVDTAYNTHDPLTTGEGSTVISQRNSEHGALDEHDKILFRMVKKEDAPRGPSFTADLHGMTSKIYSLHTTEKSALIIKQKQFDDFMQSSQIESEIDRLKEQIKTYQEFEAKFELRVTHLYETLSKSEKNARRKNLENLEEEREEVDSVYEKVLSITRPLSR